MQPRRPEYPPISNDETPPEFWRTKSLTEMTEAEWESLCDGCGLCCLLKLEDDETGEVEYTDVACRLLDCESCACSNYPERQTIVEDCVALTPEALEEVHWLPRTCGYRLIQEGADLYWWHHLVSGDRDTVHQAGISARRRVVSERAFRGDILDRTVDWPLEQPAQGR